MIGKRIRYPLKRLTALRILVMSFVLNISVGTLLLMLPFSNRSGEPLTPLDALFTATSAGCVTGLAVVDTFTQFTFFGQLVIMLLIQVGGLGFIAVTTLLMLVLGSRIGLQSRLLIMESFSTLKVGGVVQLMRRVLRYTLIIELFGALLLSIVFVPKFGFAQGLWFSIFHSVSAFCNAGFDLMGGGSLTGYVHDPIVNVVIMLLIILGGLGFIVWEDVIDKKFRFKKLCLQSKIVLTASVVLIFGGAALFYILERDYAFADMTTPQAVLAALFQSVTTRTAGFNTVDLNSLSSSGSILSILFMFIGAAPGSTGGGIKITTVVVIFFALIAFMKNNQHVNLFNRRVPAGTVERSFNAATIYAIVILMSTIIIARQDISFELVFYEVVSAIGTVGLSRGATAEYNELSKVITMLLMFAGRVGSVSVAIAVTDRPKRVNIKNVEERIITS